MLSGTFVVAVNGQAALREGKLVMLLILCVGGKITGIPFSLLQILSLLTGPIIVLVAILMLTLTV